MKENERLRKEISYQEERRKLLEEKKRLLDERDRLRKQVARAFAPKSPPWLNRFE